MRSNSYVGPDCRIYFGEAVEDNSGWFRVTKLSSYTRKLVSGGMSNRNIIGQMMVKRLKVDDMLRVKGGIQVPDFISKNEDQ